MSNQAVFWPQVLANLLSNAVKFTEKGEVVLTVAVEGDFLHFALRDTGIGISETSLGKLFQCFKQGHESMSRRYGGTGERAIVESTCFSTDSVHSGVLFEQISCIRVLLRACCT